MVRHFRVFVLTPSGRIVKKLLDTGGWCDDLAWLPASRRLLVLHDKSGTDKQDVSVYRVAYHARATPVTSSDALGMPRGVRAVD